MRRYFWSSVLVGALAGILGCSNDSPPAEPSCPICGPNQQCAATGACLCLKGFLDCDGVPENGCEFSGTQCQCVPEDDKAFCARLGKTCGIVTADASCGGTNTADCGTCVAPDTCGGGGVANVCGRCFAESDDDFCARLEKNCGLVTADNNCGERNTADCGDCSGQETCGGGGVTNVCGSGGCPAEDSAAFCARLRKDCGTVEALNNCGNPTTADCGTCIAPETCGGAGVDNVCGVCAASCDGRQCGGDGCGGSCGVCAEGSCDEESGRCIVCTSGDTRCAAGGLAIERCAADGSGWTTQPCALPGRCNPGSTTCESTVCTPGSSRCVDQYRVEICAQDGSGFDESDCRTLDAFATPQAICSADRCVDPCAEAARSGSAEGCEHWATVTPNTQLAPAFKGGAAEGSQPSTVSELALVVVNSNTSAARVRITRKAGGAEQSSPSSPQPDASGYINVPASSRLAIRLPWQSVSRTGLAPYAFRVVSDRPVAVFQLNPFSTTVGSTRSYTYDGSLLLPRHALGTRYVVTGVEHQIAHSTTGTYPAPAFMSVVAVENATQVEIRFAGKTLASESGLTVPARVRGDAASFTLNRYDVLQIVTDADARATECRPSDNPSFTQVCRYAADLSGSLVVADKPLALFGGGDCSFKPFDKFACDHLEEQLAPYAAWGKTFVGIKSPAYQTSGGTPVSSPAPDVWRIVAGCGPADCPNGTRISFNPAPLSIDKPSLCSQNVCTLPPTPEGGVAPWIEVRHGSDFIVSADQPIEVTQFLTSQNASPSAAEGDPSLTVVTPLERWSTHHAIASPSSFQRRHLLIVAHAVSPAVSINGATVSQAAFPGLVSRAVGDYAVLLVPVSSDRQEVDASVPVGVTATGYADFESFAYPGGFSFAGLGTAVPARGRGETRCSDRVDDDGDGRIDCDDFECAVDPACLVLSETACDNRVDDDRDGLADCDDPDCAGAPACPTATETHCGDAIDNDGDGMTDCADPDCAADTVYCGGGTETNCGNGIDDDGDALTDCGDPDCVSDPGCLIDCSECQEIYCALFGLGCGDGCTCGVLGKQESACADGNDNDRDGTTDCADSDCAGVSPCP